ncbi:MAG: hypothetical protein EOP10_23995 [Proteobacteria bacterium]|nr:MAG: hypothetical protein EOP10_23995 [Pseudomonadota bacterium]
MRILDICTVVGLILGLTACKTRRPTADITEPLEVRSSSGSAPLVGNTGGLAGKASSIKVDGEGDAEGPKTWLRVISLDVPDDAKIYDRVSMRVGPEGLAMQEIFDYTLGDMMDLDMNKNYKLIMDVYAGDDLVYTSESCPAGVINFVTKDETQEMKVKVCAPKAAALAPAK